ncbi:MAG: hypothetical protein RQ899_00430 [Pseudomonadales bacterium]|nr:hypothetical protein [Pseudomonadales bacterium]
MNSLAKNQGGTTRDEGRSHCLLIRAESLQLIVPRILVAEVIDLEGMEFVASLNPGIRIFFWRGYQVPLISSTVFGQAGQVDSAGHSKIIILHGVFNHDRLPFYAFIASANPRLVVVSRASIEEQAQQYQGRGADVLMPVLVDGKEAAIPKVDPVEQYIYSSLFQ